MITAGELKNRIDGLWDVFAAGGLVNPLDVIEQITYLMFIRDLDDTDNLRAKEAVMLGLPHKSIFADKVNIGIGVGLQDLIEGIGQIIGISHMEENHGNTGFHLVSSFKNSAMRRPCTA